MEVAVDREQSVAHQPDQVAEVRFAPGEVGGVRDGYVVVGGRPEHEDDVRVEQAQREDCSVALVGLEQQRQRVVGEAPGAREREASVAGRERHGCRALVAQVTEHRGEGVEVEQRRRTDERHGEKTSLELAARPVFVWKPRRKLRRQPRTAPDGGALAYWGGTESWREAPAQTKRGDVAQLVRAPPCHGGGRGFESRRSRFPCK